MSTNDAKTISGLVVTTNGKSDDGWLVFCHKVLQMEIDMQS